METSARTNAHRKAARTANTCAQRLCALAACLGLAGCTRHGASTDTEVDTPPATFAAWMPAGAQQAWQGAWSSHLTLRTDGEASIPGDPAALDIRGAVATAFDGTREHQLEFDVIAPCEAQFTQRLDDGSLKGTVFYGIQYVLDRGELRVGHGAAGYRRGRAAIVCNRGVHVLAADGTCTTWELLATWRSRAERCTWSVRGGQDVLTIGTGDWAIEVIAEGDVLVDDAFRQDVRDGHHRAVPSYAVAKRAVRASGTLAN